MVDTLLAAYGDYNNLADASARATFLRELTGVKLTPGETFTDGPGDIKVLSRILETLIKLTTTITMT